MLRRLAVCLGLLVAACGDDSPLQPADSGTVAPPPDLGPPDSGVTPFDAGTRPDTGSPDAGFADPSILGQGQEIIGGPLLFVTLRGTLTSTMPPLVLLPTGPMHGQEYLYDPTEFLLGSGGVDAPNRLMVYLDLRATGRSAFGAIGDAEVTVENHIKDVENIVTYIDGLLGRTGPIDFLGHGYGAGIAVLYAARHGDRVSRLVLSNPFPANVQDNARWNENYRARLNAAESERLVDLTQPRICLQDLERCSLEAWNIIGPTWICRENETKYRTLRFEHLDYRAFGFFINRDLRNDQYDWSTTMGLLSGIDTTIISGPCDPIPAESPMTYTASIAGSVHYVVPESGHFTLVEQAEAFRRIVLRALTY
ncbi:MAG: alpha/beta hydrolase [Myxococcota bacterium]